MNSIRQGGSYVVQKNGKRKLVARTQPRRPEDGPIGGAPPSPSPSPSAGAAEADAEAAPPAKKSAAGNKE